MTNRTKTRSPGTNIGLNEQTMYPIERGVFMNEIATHIYNIQKRRLI